MLVRSSGDGGLGRGEGKEGEVGKGKVLGTGRRRCLELEKQRVKRGI